jgi:hypothetical protein
LTPSCAEITIEGYKVRKAKCSDLLLKGISARMATEMAKTRSVEPQQRFTLPEVNWDDLNEPGAYVERGTGDLYRVPQEAIIPGGSPIIHKESQGASRLVKVSPNPFVTTLEARLRCAQHNIEPNF